MPTFKVEFPNTVRYLDGHPKGYATKELIVSAPNKQAALFHAIRVCTGEVGEPVVTVWDPEAVAPPVEVDNA
jgi:hypothetical protein